MTSQIKQGNTAPYFEQGNISGKKIIVTENIFLWLCGIILPDFVTE